MKTLPSIIAACLALGVAGIGARAQETGAPAGEPEVVPAPPPLPEEGDERPPLPDPPPPQGEATGTVIPEVREGEDPMAPENIPGRPSDREDKDDATEPGSGGRGTTTD